MCKEKEVEKNSKTQFNNYQLRQCYCFSFIIFTTWTTLYSLSQDSQKLGKKMQLHHIINKLLLAQKTNPSKHMIYTSI